MTRIRVSAALALADLAALLLAACGGGGDDNEDPQRVLSETFSNPTPIKSGNFDVDFKIETNGGESPGTVEVKLGGQFQSQAPDQFPEFDFDVSLRAESGSQTVSGSGGHARRAMPTISAGTSAASVSRHVLAFRSAEA